MENIDKLNEHREKLLESSEWPCLYMFKFIVANKDDNKNKLENLFPKRSNIKFRESKDSRFVSITAKINMKTPDDVLNIYAEAKSIKGLIAL